MTRNDAGNDGTVRHRVWRRFAGDDWAAFDALPPPIRVRLSEHAYEPWTVNAAKLWRHFRHLHRKPAHAERAMLRYLDHCERLERQMFAAAYRARHGLPLPHEAAGATVLRADAAAGCLATGLGPAPGMRPMPRPTAPAIRRGRRRP